MLWNGVANNEIAARPKNVDSCRGASATSSRPLSFLGQNSPILLHRQQYWLNTVFYADTCNINAAIIYFRMRQHVAFLMKLPL